MKRKKWSEKEEETLIKKYDDLQKSGTLIKLRTREKKFKPISDHINSLHHFHDPILFPFKWSWRDVSIKVQNMRHQYLGVKQKIRVSDSRFNWDDAVNYWENFMIYKDVFGDFSDNVDDLGFDEFDEEESSSVREKGGKRRKIGVLGGRVLELRDVLVRREERRKEGEFTREEMSVLREECRVRIEGLVETRAEIEERMIEERECELEELEGRVLRREVEREVRVEREVDEERRWRMRMEEEEMEFRERMLSLQVDHEKQMMQMHVDACHNQMQLVGFMARFMCQVFGNGGDGLGGGIGGLYSRGLGDSSKPVSDSPPEFM